MWNTIGPSCLAGLAVIVVLVPFNAVLLIKHVRELQVETLFPIDSSYLHKRRQTSPYGRTQKKVQSPVTFRPPLITVKLPFVQAVTVAP